MTRWRKLLLILSALVGFSIGVAFWQFGETKILDSLEKATRSDVHAAGHRILLVPRPGAELRDVVVSRGSVELARIPRLRLESSWVYLLTFQRKLALLDLQQAKVTIPEALPAPTRVDAGNKQTPVALLRADRSIAAVRGSRFDIGQLRIHNYGTEAISVETTLNPPHPRSGVLNLSGTAELEDQLWKDARLRGTFRLEGSDLSQYNKLAGLLRGEGKFEGPLKDVKVSGTAWVAQFAVDDNEHAVDLEAAYRASVNGQNGRVHLEDVKAKFLRTTLHVNGDVDGKSVALDFRSEAARIEDLLRIFTKGPVPALKAPMRLTAHVDLPNEDRPFLRRVRLNGNFKIDNAVWAKPGTQKRVNNLSARARGNAETAEAQVAERVFSDLSGVVRMSDGVATLRDVRFTVPGTVATGGGTYNLLTKAVNLRGTAKIEADLSESQSGWKSAILKPFNALFRRKSQGKRGAVVPVSIVGRYPRPQYKAGLTR